MKNSFNIIILGVFISFTLLLNGRAIAQNSPPGDPARNTMWLDGLGATSLGWEETPRDLEIFYNWDVINIISQYELPESVYQPELGTFDAADYLEGNLEDYDNILGVGHDIGGLVLRAMSDGSNNISAIVLCGVPNNGSKGIEMAIESTGIDGKSEAQRLIEGIEAIRDGYECEAGCSLVSLFESWIDELEDNEDIYSEMLPNSEVINTLSQEENLPQIPHAVFWGSMNEFSLTSFLSSLYLPNISEEAITNCYVDAINAWKDEVNDEREEEVWDSIFGLFNSIKNGIKNLGGENGNPLAAIAGLVSDVGQEVINWLNANEERDEELERILRCETANQYLAISWEVELMKAGSVEYVEEQIGWNNGIYPCSIFCEETVGLDDFTEYRSCVLDCINNTPSTPIYQNVLVTEPNDGLLNKNEQLLDGEAFRYHLWNTNHFQETSLYHSPQAGVAPLLPSAFNDLFDGNESAAFAVPQK